MNRLPVDDVIPDLLTALEQRNAAVLQAPPGAGKTTRVPLALLDAPWLNGKRIIMLEPRRLAATNAARWMARSLGEEAGATVGYAIRFDRRVSARTRVEVVTEGILTRRLQSDPLLEGVGAVIFDEFHERSIHSDLALALCRDVQAGLREDLRIIVMSATMAAAPVAALLGDAPVITSEGRNHPVVLRHIPPNDRENLPSAVARAVRIAARECEGDILAFLPGVGEIRRCGQLLADDPPLHAPLVVPLYGDLPFVEQERAILPVPGRRKVVLATTIAETSLTIEGVRVVVDGGQTRRLRYDPASGLNRLVTERVSAASATQRAGRAGRLGPGTCYRLWPEHNQQALLAADPPEILIADLAPLALDLAHWGVSDPASLAWLDPPPRGALEEARNLLKSLDALDGQGMITETGRRMAELPLHPRLAHMLLRATERGLAPLACDVAALLTERDIVRPAGTGQATERAGCDMLIRVEALEQWRQGRGGRDHQVDSSACRAVDRVASHLRRLIAPDGKGHAVADPVRETGLLLSWAYPDRIAQARPGGERRYLLANGRGALLSERSSLHGEQLLVAYLVERGERGDDLIRQASALDPARFHEEFSGDIYRRRTVVWDDREGRVIARDEVCYGAIVLESRPVSATGDEVRAALLTGLRVGPGITALGWPPAVRQFRARVRFLGRVCPVDGWPDLSDERLLETIEVWLGPFLGKARSLADLASIDLLTPLKALLSWDQLRRLDEGAPTHLTVPSGSRISLAYDAEGAPTLAVKLQEMFGCADTPAVAWGRVPVVVHLLSPAGRPLQVTSDLRGFWNGAYQEVKKEMRGRYPKHPWPDDPWSAVPTRRTKRSGEG
ncbi:MULTISPECIES: ATP-dependent helicase HrpB [Geobacter]|uniref:ATP-dependent helicase HrpB n=1 Tax=Geobacter TaxID=28231 RepID=UPI0025741CAE|nr:ATP-dependent helicase HrpB [Geobacter sulfurreducens]BEH10167.1 ATP-dependent helicase HrpB [Geobacter sulfurreducens subsp. ethanolicus]BET58247.1 ATP-dependent helicase HrpB [Geobacter sp. 60473]